MPAIVHIDYSLADNKKNMPRFLAIAARIEHEYYLRLAKEACENEEVSLQQREDHANLCPAP